MRNAQKGTYASCGQRRPWSACANAHADLGLSCPLTESMDNIVYVKEQRMLRSDCTDVHTDLDLRCPEIVKGPISCVTHRMRAAEAHISLCITTANDSEALKEGFDQNAQV